MKTSIGSRDWAAGLVFAVLFVVLAYLIFGRVFQTLERSAYDVGVQLRDETPSDRIAIIAIDDASIDRLGRWPWPRNLHAAMIDLLHGGGAKAIGNTVFYFEDQLDPGLAALRELSAQLAASPLIQTVPSEIEQFGAALDALAAGNAAAGVLAQRYHRSALATEYSASLDRFAARLLEAQRGLSVDDTLRQSLSNAGNVALALHFRIGVPIGRPDAPLPDYIRRNALTHIVDRIDARTQGLRPVPALAAQIPVEGIGRAAAMIGHLNTLPDVDGAMRFEPLVVQYYDAYYPSLSLAMAAAALNLGVDDIEVRLGEGIALGGLEIPTRSDLQMYTHFYGDQGGRAAFKVYSFFDVFSGTVPASQFRDKLVLIGATATGIGDSLATPVSPSMAPVEAMAHTVSSILQGDFYVRPEWAVFAEIGVLLAAALYLALLLPALGPAVAALLTSLLVVLLVGTQLYLMIDLGLWLKLVTPALLLVTGHLFMTVKRLRITEMLKSRTEVEGAESNRMLGLAFQGQGQLDMAFEKFRRVQPVDDKLLELLYNLALDFERRRQFNKAESVYQFIAEQDRDFRDVAEKLTRARRLSETVILGGGASSHPGGTMVLDKTEQMEKPMLGRYQVEKELGKGAMGIVYLGRDPKIGRQVAIKTMALSQNFEEDELDDARARFFREAETAGRLSHPNIVSIFDAGEEHDLAFIAMEFVGGHDLTRHTKANALLPVVDVLRHIADAAEALDYAHQQGVVHRDVKPANLMLVERSNTVKVMDFGIARITDSSKTKTGMVLGTPSYMSPEQLAGKKVDGRSDLFSLGVTLYQLLTGALPFQADSLATLMYRIANETPAPATTLRPDLPAGVSPILDRAMSKPLERRYALGAEFSAELRVLLQTLS